MTIPSSLPCLKDHLAKGLELCHVAVLLPAQDHVIQVAKWQSWKRRIGLAAAVREKEARIWSNNWSQLHIYKCRGRMMTYPWTVDRSRAFMNTKRNSCLILALIFGYHIWREWSVILSQGSFQAAMILSQNGFHAAMQGWCPATMWIHKYTIFGG